MAWYERSPSCVSSASRTPISWESFGTTEDAADALIDEEILLMTDAERAAFAAQQCALEEQQLARHYRGRARSASAASAASSPRRRRSPGGPRVEDRLLLHHFDRARLLDALAARHEARLRADLTFRPALNARRGAASRYREPRAAPPPPPPPGAAAFAPTVNRVPPSARGERLGAYLRTPVHHRLSRSASAASPAAATASATASPQGKPPREAAPVSAAFLRRLAEADRRRAANRERVEREAAQALTFRPALAPGTRRRRTASRALDYTRQTKPARDSVEPPPEAAPRINARSREMRRGVADLRLFEQRRLRRLQQLREEREAARKGAAPFIPVVNDKSRRIASALSGDAHESAQELMQRRAAAKAEAMRVAVEQRQREQEEEATFRPEIHAAPPYLQAIARELAANKSLAPPQPKQRPSFRFS